MVIRLAVPLGIAVIGLLLLYGFGDQLNGSLSGDGGFVFFLLIAPLAGVLGALPRLAPWSFAAGAAIPTLVLPLAMVIEFPFHGDEPWFPEPVEAMMWGLTMLTSSTLVGLALLALHVVLPPNLHEE